MTLLDMFDNMIVAGMGESAEVSIEVPPEEPSRFWGEGLESERIFRKPEEKKPISVSSSANIFGFSIISARPTISYNSKSIFISIDKMQCNSKAVIEYGLAKKEDEILFLLEA